MQKDKAGDLPKSSRLFCYFLFERNIGRNRMLHSVCVMISDHEWCHNNDGVKVMV